MNSLEIICNWFSEESNGDWEHENQIKIETTSNPGWSIAIDLRNTSLIFRSDYEENQLTDEDWYFYKIEDGKFTASGDIFKLEFLLQKFAEIIPSR